MLHDYCFFEYNTVKTSTQLDSEILLFNSLTHKRIIDYILYLQKILGKEKVVWGIKHNCNEQSWEFYFYNWDKKTELTMTNIFDISKDFFITEIIPNENIPYFMFSIDITEELFDTQKLHAVHIYLEGANFRQHGGSYLLSKNNVEFENTYSTYNPTNKEQREHLIGSIFKSPRVDFTKVDISKLLWTELFNCYTICLSRKRFCEGIYYSRLNIEQFLIFLKKFNYDYKFIEQNKNKLDYLKFDVGFDYTYDTDLQLIKSGYYGIF